MDSLPSKLSLPKHCRSAYAIVVSRPAKKLHSMMTTMEAFASYYCLTYVAMCWIFPISHYLRLDSAVSDEKMNYVLIEFNYKLSHV